MKSYSQWNSVIVDYVTSNVPPEGGVFLSIDDDALKEIGHSYLMLDRDQAVTDFEKAVRRICKNGDVFSFSKDVNGHDEQGRPNCVAFLSSMVLAAHRMKADEAVSDSNYFMRFSDILEIPVYGGDSRPNGMVAGCEEKFWEGWNQWLIDHGWQPTSVRGAGSHIYINYPIEQSTLRDGDKVLLQNKYKAKFSSKSDWSMDEEHLGHWLSFQDFTRKHLKKGFNEQNISRLESFYSAAYKVYQNTNRQSLGLADEIDITHHIDCGIYRTVSISGKINYQIFPKVPLHWKSSRIEVTDNQGETKFLEKFRPNLFRPLWKQKPFVKKNSVFDVKGDQVIESMNFPSRDYWILTMDPSDPSGLYATWEKIPQILGKKIIVLIAVSNSKLISSFENYRDEGLINWGEREEHDDVIEYRGCMVLQRSWESINPKDSDKPLLDALRPKNVATISLQGGLSAPNQNAWIKGYPPDIKVYGFEETFKLSISRLDVGEENKPVLAKQPVNTQEITPLKELTQSGTYVLEIFWGEKCVAKRTMKIIDWSNLLVTQ